MPPVFEPLQIFARIRSPVPIPTGLAAVGLQKTTTRFVLVPLELFSTPQQFAVLVNLWSLISAKTGLKPAWTPHGNTFLKLDFAAANLANLECHVSARTQYAKKFPENFSHGRLPGFKFARPGDLHGRGVNTDKPAPQPIVAGVIDHVEERRRGEDFLRRISR